VRKHQKNARQVLITRGFGVRLPQALSLHGG
jgi:hypothetical protein